jgi:hypothetical protein
VPWPFPYAIAFSSAVLCSIVHDSKQLLSCPQAILARGLAVVGPLSATRNGVSLRSGCGRQISLSGATERRGPSATEGVSDHGLRGLRTCALAVPLAALLAAISLGAPDGGGQSGSTYRRDCYVLTCERRPAPARLPLRLERVCRPVVGRMHDRNVQRCHA